MIARQLIVVVEDDPSMSQALQRLLNAAGLTAAVFGSAEALLESGTVAEATCCIFDVQLPGLSGFELWQRLRARGLTVPVVFITAYDLQEARDMAANLGAAGYFPKPFTGRDLLRTVGGALQIEFATKL